MKIYVIFTCFILIVGISNGELPSLFPVCLRTDPNINQCVIDSIKALQPRFASGDLGPGFRIPPAEPFVIPQLKYSSTSFIKSNSVLSDVHIKGISKFEIEKVNFDVKQLKFVMYLFIPRIDISANYQLNLTLLHVPLMSAGKVSSVYENIRVRVFMTAQKFYTATGEEHIRFNPLEFKFIQWMVKELKFSYLFDNHVLLGRLARSFLINNRQYLSTYVTEDFEAVSSTIFTDIANIIASQASFGELFPL